ncbi:MAG: type II toxin-antitoxin system ParD family antitoxin [Planctomycetia bacterium]|nr:type II toxin-antitoxin system ParD family antitoxin [Planctomycetia bacterium]
MPIEIPSEFRPFVDQELQTGLYRSDQDVVNKALEMLRREREEALAGIREGLADVEAGRVQSLDDAFEDLRVEFGLPPGE